MSSSRVTRIAILTVSGVLLVFAAWEVVFLWSYIDAQDAIGTDLRYYVDIANRWLQTGEFYLPRQLEGPYVVVTDYDVLYPPIALLLFVPFVWLPYPLWWILPGIVVGVVVWRFRPAPWTWPLLAFAVAWPRNVSSTIYGNSDIWILTFIAAGLVVGWPAILTLIKPSLGFFALIGIRRRSWWIAAGALAAISIPMLPLWADYVTAVRNSTAEWHYSLGNLPTLIAPIWAWLGRRDGGFRTLADLRRAIRPVWRTGGPASDPPT